MFFVNRPFYVLCARSAYYGCNVRGYAVIPEVDTSAMPVASVPSIKSYTHQGRSRAPRSQRGRYAAGLATGGKVTRRAQGPRPGSRPGPGLGSYQVRAQAQSQVQAQAQDHSNPNPNSNPD